MIKAAYICEPHQGGLYTFYLEMRPALRAHGIELNCLNPYPAAQDASPDAWSADGVVLFKLPQDASVEPLLQMMIRHLEEEQYQAVIVIPGNSPAGNILPAIVSRSMTVIGLVPHNGRGVYKPTSLLANHLDWIVAVNDQLKTDLIERYGVPADKVFRIFTGVSMSLFQELHPRPDSARLKVVFNSRLEDLQKNVLLLPDVLAETNRLGTLCQLQIMASGPSEEELQKKFDRLGLSDQVQFNTRATRQEMLDSLQSADVVLMTSRFEGCPHALIEGMASGCVPVATYLRGITGTMIDDGREGFLCEVNNYREFASRLHTLARDHALRRKMSGLAHERALKDFDIQTIARAYAALIAKHNPAKEKNAIEPGKAAKKYMDLNQSRLRALVPQSIKKVYRNFMAKRGKSV